MPCLKYTFYPIACRMHTIQWPLESLKNTRRLLNFTKDQPLVGVKATQLITLAPQPMEFFRVVTNGVLQLPKLAVARSRGRIALMTMIDVLLTESTMDPCRLT